MNVLYVKSDYEQLNSRFYKKILKIYDFVIEHFPKFLISRKILDFIENFSKFDI